MSSWPKAEKFSQLSLASFQSDQRPLLALHHLSQWEVITVTGTDARHYLQGQLTCDVVTMPENSVSFAAHCDAKGRMHSAMRVFSTSNGYGYLQRRSVTPKQVAELKKYAVFSKVDITVDERILLGLSGMNATAFIEQLFTGDGAIRHHADSMAIQVAPQRWVIMAEASLADTLMTTNELTLASTALWELYEIEAACPRIDEATWGTHLPQALNLQAVGGISFKKGCYTGQEMVARAKYRGINKRAMFIVRGHCDTTPCAGDEVERQVGDSWRRGGVIIAGCRADDGEAIALAVLPNDLELETALRFANAPESLCQLTPLPYSLDDEQ
ncbi:tRNA-modifying protein YgfZ [Thaumasiovibrio sp. DFM-14]|uniref:tRNA-modifying protein YgfZ n=1 Tax=Thaumasiovibrio sp. DFM-14 TaxID=3384792 RepID=UPI0039A299B8